MARYAESFKTYNGKVLMKKIGREQRRAGLIDKARQRREARQFLRAVGLDVDPAVLVSTMLSAVLLRK